MNPKRIKKKSWSSIAVVQRKTPITKLCFKFQLSQQKSCFDCKIHPVNCCVEDQMYQQKPCLISKNEIKVVLVIYKCISLNWATFSVLGIVIGPSKVSLRSQHIATKILESKTFVQIVASVEKACDKLKVCKKRIGSKEVLLRIQTEVLLRIRIQSFSKELLSLQHNFQQKD